MQKKLVRSGLVLVVLFFNSLMAVSSLQDGVYFSEDLQGGDIFKWEVKSYYEDGSDVESDKYGLGLNSTITLEILQDLLVFTEETPVEISDYFSLSFDGVVVSIEIFIWVFVIPLKYVIEGIEINTFEDDDRLVINGNIATSALMYDYSLDSDNYRKEEDRYNINTGLLVLLHNEVVTDGIVEEELLIELVNDGELSFDNLFFYYVLPVLMIPVIINKKRK